MQALNISLNISLNIPLRPDRTVLTAWFIVHAFACFVLTIQQWPPYFIVIGLVLLLSSWLSGGRRLMLRIPSSIIGIQRLDQDWRVQYRNGETVNAQLITSMITGDWVWLQFRVRRLSRVVVLMTPQNSDLQSLRRLRVMLLG